MSTIKVRNVLSPDGGVADNLKPVTASAWVNFNGTGTLAILDSHNVSSVADGGVGNYLANYAVSLQDDNYATVVSGRNAGGGSTYAVNDEDENSVRIVALTSGGGGFDSESVSVVIFGGQS